MRLFVGMMAVMLSASAASAQPARTLTGASTADHLWLVVPSGAGSGHLLLHQPRVEVGPHMSAQRTLVQAPEAIAAWDDRVWIVSPPADSPRGLSRSVFTLQVALNPAVESYYTLPQDRLGVVEPLPGEGAILSLIGGSDGPLALMTEDDPDAPPTLLQLRGGQWQPIALPDAVGAECRLLPMGGHRVGPSLLCSMSERPGMVQRLRRDAEDRWVEHLVPADLGRVIGITSVDRRIVLAAVTDTATDEPTCELSYLGDHGTARLMSFPVPPHPWVVLGVADGPRLIQLDGSVAPAGATLPPMRLSRIDPVSGAMSSPELVTKPPSGRAAILHLSLLLAMAVTAALIVLVFRPTAEDAVSLPEDLCALPLGRRAIALLIDLLPGAAVAWGLVGIEPADLARAPMFTADLADSGAYLLMVLITILHSVISESVTGRTLGKLIVGGWVVTQQGQRPSVGRVVIRNFLKLLVLALPPLALLTLINPHAQSVHDVFAQTVVVGKALGQGTEE